ncbi:MAG: hypothetical protein LBM76_02860 [Mycoplasmataceae bacterium]|nr:hypothetical protein [Mycoplasmataceae bacterium]
MAKASKVFTKCPCINKQCALWGNCKECRKAMSSEGTPPACEQMEAFKYINETR